MSLTPDQLLIAIASMPPASEYRRLDSIRRHYLTPLPFDSYRTAYDENGRVKLFGYHEDGTRMLAYYKGDTVDGKHKVGEPVLNADGVHVYEATGIFIENYQGQHLKLYDSLLRKLAISTQKEDISVWDAFTSNNSHGPVFSGAVIFGTIIEKNSRGVSYPRIVERLY